jgi:hypothetical protein
MICRWLIVALPLPVSVIGTAIHGHFGSFKIVGRFTLNVGSLYVMMAFKMVE